MQLHDLLSIFRTEKLKIHFSAFEICTRANKYYFLDDLVSTVVIQNASRNSRPGVEAFSKGTR